MKIYNNKDNCIPWGYLNYIKVTSFANLKSLLTPFTIPEDCLQLPRSQVDNGLYRIVCLGFQIEYSIKRGYIL